MRGFRGRTGSTSRWAASRSRSTGKEGNVLRRRSCARARRRSRAAPTQGKYQTIADIDRPGTRVIVNPGGTNERFARANIKNAEIRIYADNVTIFDEIAKGNADLMMTDSSETRYQQKLHPGVLCAVHPDKPFDFAEKAYWLQRDAALKAFVDHWLHIAIRGRQLCEDLCRLV